MRKTWHEYFGDIALQVATRATCPRKHVGCVIVDGRIDARYVLVTGYNGSMRGQPHCEDAGCDIVESRGPDGATIQNCVRTVHAEANAVAQAAARGISLQGSIAYVTAMPCWPCYKLLGNAGIREIIYCEQYKLDPRVSEAQGWRAPPVLWIEDRILDDMRMPIALQGCWNVSWQALNDWPGPTQRAAKWTSEVFGEDVLRAMERYQRCRDMVPDFEVRAHQARDAGRDARDSGHYLETGLWAGGVASIGGIGVSHTYGTEDKTSQPERLALVLSEAHKVIAARRWAGGL